MSNYIRNVAIVGAGGNSGSHMARALLATGNHTITAITRADSKSVLPAGVKTAIVDYSDPSTIVASLKGQDALIITLSVLAHDANVVLLKAAADAEVPWVLPNEYSPDTANEGLVKDVMPFQGLVEARKQIEEYGRNSWLGLSCGFWYEWSMAIPLAFGFDFASREVTLFDEGETLTSVTTWPQVGRAVAALLSLPVKAEEGKTGGCLETYRNQMVYVKSFTVTHRHMFESVLRVTGTKEGDWKVTKQPTKERFEEGNAEMQGGNRGGMVKAMYSRVFYPDGVGNIEKNHGTLNEILGLPEEDIDEATAKAIEMSKKPLY